MRTRSLACLCVLVLMGAVVACGDDTPEVAGDGGGGRGRDGAQSDGHSGRDGGAGVDASVDGGVDAGSVRTDAGRDAASAADAGSDAGMGDAAGGSGGSGGAGSGGTGGGGSDAGLQCPPGARCHSCAELTDPALRPCQAAGWGGACFDAVTDAVRECVCQSCATECDDGGQCRPFAGASSDACAACVETQRAGACAASFDACAAGLACPAGAAVPATVQCPTSDLEGSSRSCRVLLTDCADAADRAIECDYDGEGAYECECVAGGTCERAFSIPVSRNSGSFCFDAWYTLLQECGVTL